MTDLKFIGINVPTVLTQRQADPDNDSLLMSNYRPSGGASGPFLVTPVAQVTGGDDLFQLEDGNGTTILDITADTGVGTGTFTGDWNVTGDLVVTGAATVNGGPSAVNDDIVFGNDSGDTVTFARDWIDGTDLSYSSTIIFDPGGTPTFGTDGTPHIVVGTGVDPTVNGTDGSYNPPSGSMLLQTDGSLWMKTGAAVTSWSQMATAAGATTSLNAVITTAPILNDVDVPAAARLVFRDAAATFTVADNLLELERTQAGAGTGLFINHSVAGNTGDALRIAHVGTGDGISVNHSGSAGNVVDFQDNGTSMFTLAATGAVTLTSTNNGNVDITADGTGDTTITTDALDVNATGAITMDTSAGGISLGAVGASDFTVAAAADETAGDALTLESGAGGASVGGAAGGAGADLVGLAGAGGAGDATNAGGSGGDATLTAGAGGADGGGGGAAGGDVVVIGGAGTGAAVAGGVTLDAGANAGGTDGDIVIGGTTANLISIGAASAVGGNPTQVNHESVADAGVVADDVVLLSVGKNAGAGAGSGTAAGAYAVGVDVDLLTNITVGAGVYNLMDVLDSMDTAIGAIGGTVDLQSAYDQGQSIDTNTLDLAVDISHTDGTGTHNLLELDKSPSAALGGNALDVTLGANATGRGLEITNGGSGEGIVVDANGTGAGIVVQNDGGGTGMDIIQGTADATNLFLDKNVGASPALDIDVDAASGANAINIALANGAGTGVDITLDANDFGIAMTDGSQTVTMNEDYIQYDGGATAGFYDVQTLDQSTVDVAGHGLRLSSGAGGAYSAAAAGAGGAITASAGTGGSSGSAVDPGAVGGVITLTAGVGGGHSAATGVAGDGGALSLFSGDGGTNSSTGTGGAGGQLNLQAGGGGTGQVAGVAGPGGAVTILGGLGNTTGASGGNGGSVSITGGAGGVATSQGGGVNINGGFGTGANGVINIMTAVGGNNDEQMNIGNTTNYPPTSWDGKISQTNDDTSGISLQVAHAATAASPSTAVQISSGSNATGIGVSIEHEGSGVALDVIQSGSATNIQQWYSGTGPTDQRMSIARTGVLTIVSDETADSGVTGAPDAANQLVLSTLGGGVADAGILTADSDPGAGTGIQANQGSIALGTDGTMWLKDGVAATAWSQLQTAATASLDLDTVITSAPIDNDVDIPSGSPLIFNDGGTGGFTLLTLSQTGASELLSLTDTVTTSDIDANNWNLEGGNFSFTATQPVAGTGTIGREFDITSGAGSDAATATAGAVGGTTTITGGIGGASDGTDSAANGGGGRVIGGAGGAGSGAVDGAQGGNASLAGGLGGAGDTAAAGDGGDIVLDAGNAGAQNTGTGGTGGSVVINPGQGTGANNDGAVLVARTSGQSILLGQDGVNRPNMRVEVGTMTFNPAEQGTAPNAFAQQMVLSNNTGNVGDIQVFTTQQDPNTVVTAPQGSIALADDNTVWVNTDGVTAWDQFITGTAADFAQNLDNVITTAGGGTVDNTVSIPTGNELDFTDNAVALTNSLMTIRRTAGSTGGLDIIANGTHSGAALNITHTGSNSAIVIDNGTVGSTLSGNILQGGPDDDLFVLGGSAATLDGGDVLLGGGATVIGGGTGGNALITGGSGATDGQVLIGQADTLSITVGVAGAVGTPTTVNHAAVAGTGGNASVGLNATGSGTSGSIAIGVFDNFPNFGPLAVDDLQSALEAIDTSVGTALASDTLQEAYTAGNTIAVTTANGTVDMSNAADTTDVLSLARTFAGAGNALDITMDASATGNAIFITDNDAAAGTMSIDPSNINVDGMATFTLDSVASTTGNGTHIDILGGDTSNNGSEGGDIDIIAGTATGTGSDGGDILIDAGAGTSNNGSIVIGAGGSPIATSIDIGHASGPTTMFHARVSTVGNTSLQLNLGNDALSQGGGATSAAVGSYAVGVDAFGLPNIDGSTAITNPDLQTVLEAIDTEIGTLQGASSPTLQDAYDNDAGAPATIDVSAAGSGTLQFINTTDATDVLTLEHSGAGSSSDLLVMTDGTSTTLYNESSISHDGAGSNDFVISTVAGATVDDIDIVGGPASAGTGGAFTVTAGSGTTAGGAVDITAGAGTTNAVGGALLLSSGTGAGAQSGGITTLSSGDGGATGAGGVLNILSGDGTGGNGGNINVTAGDSDGGAGAQAGSIDITAGGRSVAGGSNGTVTITGGSGVSAATSAGGAVALAGGDGSASGGAGGGVSIDGGNGSAAANSLGGAITMISGDGNGTGAAGALTIGVGTSGNTATTPGLLSISGGTAGTSATAGGDVTVDAGTATGINGVGGDLQLAGGFASNGTSTGGNVEIDAGDGGTTAGTVYVGASRAGVGVTAAVEIGTDGASGNSVLIQSGNSQDITFDARGMTNPIELNEAGDLDLDGAYATAGATSIIGALNALATGGVTGTPGVALTTTLVVQTGETIPANGLVSIDPGTGRAVECHGNNLADACVVGINTGSAVVGNNTLEVTIAKDGYMTLVVDGTVAEGDYLILTNDDTTNPGRVIADSNTLNASYPGSGDYLVYVGRALTGNTAGNTILAAIEIERPIAL